MLGQAPLDDLLWQRTCVFLQTTRAISSEHTTTTLLRVPIDLFCPFLKGQPKV